MTHPTLHAHPRAGNSPELPHATETNPDAAILARLRTGEDAAFEELVRLASPRMLAVARRLLASDEDAHDAVQEAFLSAIRALPGFDARSRLSTWLHRITVNACLMRLRSARRRPEVSLDALLPRFRDDGHQQPPSIPWKPIADTGIESAEMAALVRAQIDCLPLPYREVLLLRDIEELDTEQTAAMLGISCAAVKTRLHRARQALRTLLDPYFSRSES